MNSKRSKRKKEQRKKTLFYNIVGITLLCSTLLLIVLLKLLDILPTKYFILVTAVTLLINLFIVQLIIRKNIKEKIKKHSSKIGILFIIIIWIISIYLIQTLHFFNSFSSGKYKIENYSVIVLKESSYDDLKDIKDKTITYYSNTVGINQALEHVKEKVPANYKENNDPVQLVDKLINKQTDAILIEDSVLNIVKEEQPDIEDKIKVIYTFTIKTEAEYQSKKVNLSKDTYNVYISGIDTYGQISSVSRSDVNMVMTINPKTHQVLLTSIPRDYYVHLHNVDGLNDKLTHAGIYGMDMSIHTIEDLLDIEINYYVKVNFTSLIDIVNALDGINIYSEYAFTSIDGYNYSKGYNKVNGEEALSFVRERKSFAQGDRQRGKNQQAAIEAIIRKATSSSILTKYNSLLKSLENKFQTNMSSDEIKSIIKRQIDNNVSWTVTSNSLTGADGRAKTYSASAQEAYVMIPDEESIENAKNLIAAIKNNEELDSSYQPETAGKKVTKTEIVENPPQEVPKEPEKVVTQTTEEDKKLEVTFQATTVEDTTIMIKTIVNSQDENLSYKYIINDKEYSSDSAIYTFKNLTPETDYKIKVEVSDSKGNSGAASFTITTKSDLPEVLEP